MDHGDYIASRHLLSGGGIMIVHYTHPVHKATWHYVIRKYVWGDNLSVAKEDLHIDMIIDNMGTRKGWQFDGRFFENLGSVRKSLLCQI